MLDIIVSLLIVIGSGFALTGSIGLTRFADFYSRLHGPTKATTLGVGSLLVASVVYFSANGEGISLREILVTVFLFMTAPVSAHLLSRAALHLRVRSVSAKPVDKEHPLKEFLV